jgi:hypothetical protein
MIAGGNGLAQGAVKLSVNANCELLRIASSSVLKA